MINCDDIFWKSFIKISGSGKAGIIRFIAEQLWLHGKRSCGQDDIDDCTLALHAFHRKAVWRAIIAAKPLIDI